MSKEIDDKIKSIIGKVAKLGWLQKMDDQIYINLADVEKIIYCLLDEDYMLRVNAWAKESEGNGIAIKEPPELKPRDYDQLKRDRAHQAEILGKIMKGEEYVFKEGCCPFEYKAGKAKRR